MKSEQCINPAPRARIIQIHPTLKCNLTCKHCYSSSAPSYKTGLQLYRLQQFLSYAFGEGYDTISLSGGEPFLYQDLEGLLAFSRAIGYRNVVASNGMLLTSKRSAAALEYVDLIAVSLDGPADLHNEMRGHPKAFDQMLAGVEVLQSRGLPFGFIHTITMKSWDSLIWLGEFAQGHGASLLQLHPLEMHGRAVYQTKGLQLDEETLHKVYFLATYLKSKYEPGMFVQLDMLHREYLRAQPGSASLFLNSSPLRLADVLDSITITESGDVLPIGYGVSAAYRICNIYDGWEDEAVFQTYLDRQWPGLQSLLVDSFDAVLGDAEHDLVNWNELVIGNSNMRYPFLAKRQQKSRKKGITMHQGPPLNITPHDQNTTISQTPRLRLRPEPVVKNRHG